MPLTSFIEARPVHPEGQGRMACERRAEGPGTARKVGPPGQNDQGPAQGDTPMSGWQRERHVGLMASYLLHHRHEPDECGVVFASFKGHASPLRHRPTLASCRTGGHAIWWTVEANSEADALALLPFYVAERTTITRVSEVQIP